MSLPDPYETLGVARTATAAEIQAAFRRLAYLHPDQHPNDPTAPARFARVTAAYALLSDPVARDRYDRMPPAARGQITDAIDFINEIANDVAGLNPAHAALGVADRVASPEGRRELRTVWSGLKAILTK